MGRNTGCINPNTLEFKEALQGIGNPILAELYLLEKQKNVPATKASPKQVALVKDTLERLGVTIESATLDWLRDNGFPTNWAGKADLTNKLVALVSEREDIAVTEELAHFVIAIVKQKDPALYKKLFNKVGQYKMYEQVRGNKLYTDAYRNKDGTLDIPKLKEEAMGKILAEYITKVVDGDSDVEELITEVPQEQIDYTRSWWQEVVNFLKNLFNKAFDGNTDELYNQLAQTTVNDKLEGTAEDITEEGEFYSLQGTPQESTFNKLLEDSKRITTDRNGKYFYAGKETISKKEKDLDKKEEFIKDVNIKGKKEIIDILNRYIDTNGQLRVTALPKSTTYDIGGEGVYNTLDSTVNQYLHDKTLFPEGTLFIAGPKVYSKNDNSVSTSDLIAVTPDNKVSILNFDFMSFSETKYKDIPSEIRKESQKKVLNTKRVLRENYNIKDFGTTRTTPVILNFNYKDGKYSLKSVKTEKTSVVLPNYLKQLPTPDELTGIPKIDKLINQLNAALNKISSTKAPEGRGDIKKMEVDSLFSAIRHLQIEKNFKPLFSQVETLLTNTETLLSSIRERIEKQDSLSPEEERSTSEELNDFEYYLGIYKDIDIYFKNFFKADSEEAKEVKTLGQEARHAYEDLKDTRASFANKFIASKYNIKDLSLPEKVYKGLTKYVRSFSQAPTDAMQVVYKIIDNTRTKSEFEFKEKYDRLKEIHDKIEEAGISNKQLKDLVTKPYSNKLIDEFSPEFYKQLKEAIEKKDIKWIKENIDEDAFREWATSQKERMTKQAEDYAYWEDVDKNSMFGEESFKKKWLNDINKQTNLNEKIAWLNYNNVKKFPAKKWESEEYKKLKVSPEAFSFYKFVREINILASKEGYINPYHSREFLPFIRKNVAERVMEGQGLQFKDAFLAAITIDENTQGFGVRNPFTGELEDTIPSYFTKEISNDEISDDLFKNMLIYAHAVVDYNNKKQAEDIVRVIYNIEKNKQSLQTDSIGRIIKEAGEVQVIDSNEPNTKLLQTYMRNALYGQRFPNSAVTDWLFGKGGDAFNNLADKVNNKLGVKVLPKFSEDLTGRQLSASRAIDVVNRFFQMKVLGLKLTSSISQFMGGNAQAFINTGEWYSNADFRNAEFKIAAAKLFKNNEALSMLLIKELLPLSEGKLHDWVKELSLKTINQYSMSDFLMSLMRKADHIVQYANFLSMIENAVVIDGEVVNARKYIRQSPEYAKRYDSPDTLSQSENSFDEQVAKLIEEKGLINKHAQVKDGKLTFEGVDMESLYKYRSIIQQTSKVLTGNIAPHDEALFRMNILGKSLSLFKNWIVRPFDNRFGELRYDAGTEKYEAGRVREMAKMIFQETGFNLKRLNDISSANKEGVEILKNVYEKRKKEYEERTNKPFNMTEAEYYDMVRQTFSANLKDLVLSLSLLGLYFAAKANAPDDDDTPITKNWYKYSLRTIDKVSDELLFYYSPVQMQGILGGSIFPSIGVFSDVGKMVSSLGEEGFGFVTNNQELQDSAHPIKYMMKTFPITSELTTYIALFAPDLAKELGIKIGTQSRVH